MHSLIIELSRAPKPPDSRLSITSVGDTDMKAVRGCDGFEKIYDGKHRASALEYFFGPEHTYGIFERKKDRKNEILTVNFSAAIKWLVNRYSLFMCAVSNFKAADYASSKGIAAIEERLKSPLGLPYFYLDGTYYEFNEFLRLDGVADGTWYIGGMLDYHYVPAE